MMNTDRFFSVFKTAGRGLAAQRQQISVASENIANAGTTRGLDGRGPYRPKMLHATAGEGRRFHEALKGTMLELRTTGERHIGGPTPPGGGDGTSGLGPQTEVVAQDKFRFEYDPDHPDADENGMVKYPDVDMVEEMTRMVSANRLYEANLSVIEAEKQNIKNAFKI